MNKRNLLLTIFLILSICFDNYSQTNVSHKTISYKSFLKDYRKLSGERNKNVFRDSLFQKLYKIRKGSSYYRKQKRRNYKPELSLSSSRGDEVIVRGSVFRRWANSFFKELVSFVSTYQDICHSKSIYLDIHIIVFMTNIYINSYNFQSILGISLNVAICSTIHAKINSIPYSIGWTGLHSIRTPK